MNRSTRRDDDQGEIIGRLRRIPDFLPPPSELARDNRPETVKVTLDLDREAVEWFKHEAKRYGGSYQRMIRNLAMSYVRGAGRLPSEPADPVPSTPRRGGATSRRQNP